MQRTILALAAFIACLAAVAPAHGETDKVDFVLDWVVYGRHTPYFVSLEKGFFQSRNIEPKIERGYGSAAGLKRIAAGQADFLFADFGGLILARANEALRAKMIAVVYGKNGHAVHYLESSGIKAAADLAGKRLAGAPGTTVAALFPGFLRANKVDPERVKVISVDPQALNPVLLAKQFDGMLEFNFNNVLLVKEGAKSGLKPDYMMYADHNFRFYANGIITTDAIIAEKPDLARRFVAAILEGVQYSFDHPEESCTLLRKHAPSVDQDVCLAELAMVKDLVLTDEAKANGIGYMSVGGVQKTIDVMRDNMGLKASIAPQDAFDMRFLPKPGSAMMGVHEIVADELAYPPKFGSPTALAIRADNFLYVSGMMPWDKDRRVVGVGDVKEQTRQALRNMAAVLNGAGASLADIIKINFFLTDIRDKNAVWDVRKEMFGDSRPASTLVEVVHLVDPLALLEVEAVAYLGTK